MSAETTTKRDDSGIGRRIAIAVLVIVGCLAIALANLYTWAVRTTLTTDAWVAATAPLASDPDVQAAVGTLVLEKLDEAVDIEAIVANRLPEPLAPLAPLVAAQVRQTVSGVVFDILAGDAFASAWETAMREGHGRIVAFVRETDVDPTIPLKIDKLVEALDQRLSGFGIDLFPEGSPPSLGDIAIRVDQRFDQVRTILGWAERLVWIMPIVALLAFGGALLIARRRSRLLVTIAASAAVALTIEFIALRVLASEISSIPRREIYAAGVEAMLSILLAGLFAQTQALIIVAVVIAVAAWTARAATGLDPVRRFVVRYGRPIQVITAGLVLAYLLLGPNVTIVRALLVGSLALAAIIGVEAIVRDEYGDDEPIAVDAG
ncbi:MAG TPA: hypothetical protein VJZ72_00170 [Candidatus Limnocylindrales bacterium]|nr:hypothetical protein [Candidatus Limnocylindrales bacterium]